MATEYYFKNEQGYSEPITCPAETLANLLGRKWVPLIIEHIATTDDIRFGQMLRQLDGQTAKVLKQQLSLLEDNDIISNEKIEIENTVESYYRLTPIGESLFPIIKSMKIWGSQHLECPPKQ